MYPHREAKLISHHGKFYPYAPNLLIHLPAQQL